MSRWPRDFVTAYPELDRQHFLTLPNGYDLDDFAQAEPLVRRGRTTAWGSSTAAPSTASAPRSPFLQALRSVLERRPDTARSGTGALRGQRGTGNGGSGARAGAGLWGVVEITGYVSHQQSIGYVLGADILLLMIAPDPGSEGVLTGKVFEYLAAARPILALTPPGARPLIDPERAKLGL